MINQKHCPFCLTPAVRSCQHLAVSVEARDFVLRCVQLSESVPQWEGLCQQRQLQLQRLGNGVPEREDFMWLETAFCDKFLKPLSWFGSMDYEWRTTSRPDQGAFWVLLWSKEPKRLWWELHDRLEQFTLQMPAMTSVRQDNFLPL